MKDPNIKKIEMHILSIINGVKVNVGNNYSYYDSFYSLSDEQQARIHLDVSNFLFCIENIAQYKKPYSVLKARAFDSCLTSIAYGHMDETMAMKLYSYTKEGGRDRADLRKVMDKTWPEIFKD